MSIGQRIKTIRKRQGLSIDEVASKLGKNRTTIYRYENGDIENLPLGILDPLANALNTTPSYLMGWDNSNRICHGTETDDVPEEIYTSEWLAEVGTNTLSEEEYRKVIEYAKFLLSMRDK